MQCDRCGAFTHQKTCSTCEAMAYAAGDAFTMLCEECNRGFVTADPRRDLCCFCMKRSGANYGGNRRAHSQASHRSHRAADSRPSRPTASPFDPFTRSGRPLQSAGIRTGEITGWRAWYVINTQQGIRLRSMAVDCVWEPGSPVSVNSVLDQCGYRDKWERIPPGVGAGIHAFKTAREMVRQYNPGPRVVYGTVAMWGEVIEHEMGYRAEFGRVASVDRLGDMVPEERALLEHLRRTYKV